ncbi:D-hydantoinase [Peptoclostridium acidaminophilum DSM 3953]|uniref:D-hydantoinase n=1 Tax=Peptoclostridium acidaminophilum DSM 3953 TaxID=1286171 RepID=W8T644_PEPAC|nr:dihydropyrimidinase [Peptoclostridium acidaminophilum]AHM57199.1 D-hydantoinase [Peptoclostridium acidaminophilum DSM 3953]
MSMLIKNGVVVTAFDEFEADILVEGGKIKAIGKELGSGADEVVDAKGMYVLPGGIDQHVHFSFDYKGSKVRGFETSNAAAAGGTTTVIEFVNQIKGKGLVDSIEDYRKSEVDGVAMVDYSFHGVITDPTPEVFNEMDKLVDAGYSTIKLFMAYKGMFFHADDDAILNALIAAKDAGVTIMVHAENADAIDVLQKRLVAEGKTEPYYHAVSRPPLVEAEATKRAIYLAQMAGAPIYIVHVSCKEAIDEIRNAYVSGIPVYGETCSHYLVLDESNLAKPNFEGAKYVCSPALRTPDHHEALWDAVDMGWLNAVSSDHCGFDWKEQKHMGRDCFTDIPNGAPGLENRLAVLWTYGVEKNKISRQKLVDIFATTPAKINGIADRKGHIAVGYDADIVIFNPEYKGVMTNETCLHNVDYSPYEGMEQIGRVEKVFLRGNQIVECGKYVGNGVKGELVKGKAYGLCYDRMEK